MRVSGESGPTSNKNAKKNECTEDKKCTPDNLPHDNLLCDVKEKVRGFTNLPPFRDTTTNE